MVGFGHFGKSVRFAAARATPGSLLREGNHMPIVIVLVALRLVYVAPCRRGSTLASRSDRIIPSPSLALPVNAIGINNLDDDTRFLMRILTILVAERKGSLVIA